MIRKPQPAVLDNDYMLVCGPHDACRDPFCPCYEEACSKEALRQFREDYLATCSPLQLQNITCREYIVSEVEGP